MEKGPKKPADKIFIEDWTKVADNWLFMIRNSKISENIQTELETIIEEGFKKGYLGHIGRNDKEIIVFLEKIYNKFEEASTFAQEDITKIFKKISLDIKILITGNRN